MKAKRIYRLYNEMGLQLRNKTPKRRVKAKLREDRVDTTSSNETWAIVNARLIVRKQSRQLKARRAPMEPKMIARNGHYHRAHSKVQPPCGAKGSHACINKRQPSLAPCPNGQSVGVRRRRSDPNISTMQVFKLDPRCVLQFLDEMAMAVQTARKRRQCAAPSISRGTRFHLPLARPCGLHNLTQRQGCPMPNAATAESTHVRPPLGKTSRGGRSDHAQSETNLATLVRQAARHFDAPLLHQGKTKHCCRGDIAGLNGDRGQAGCLRNGLRHKPIPLLRPPIARRKTSLDAMLGYLMPW